MFVYSDSVVVVVVVTLKPVQTISTYSVWYLPLSLLQYSLLHFRFFFVKAVANDDREGIALASLAKLYSAAGRRDSAAKCYETMLANRSADGDVRILRILVDVTPPPSLPVVPIRRPPPPPPLRYYFFKVFLSRRNAYVHSQTDE